MLAPSIQTGAGRARVKGVRIVCPACNKVIEDAPEGFPPRPFCSPRCKLADLHGWLSERYVISQPIPAVGTDEDEHFT